MKTTILGIALLITFAGQSVSAAVQEKAGESILKPSHPNFKKSQEQAKAQSQVYKYTIPLEGIFNEKNTRSDSAERTFGHVEFRSREGKAKPMIQLDQMGWKDPRLSGLTPAEFAVYTKIVEIEGVKQAQFIRKETARFDITSRTAAVETDLEVTLTGQNTAKRVAEVLDTFRAAARSVYTLEIFAVDHGPVGNVPNKSERNPVTHPLGVSEFDTERERYKKLEGSAHPKLLIDQNVNVRFGEEASVAVIQQHSFITDFEVHSSRGSMVADPVIDVVQEGLLILATPIVEGVSGQFHLHFSVRISDLLDPPVEREMILPGDRKVKIQFPETVDSTWNPGRMPMPVDGIRVTGLKRVDAKSGFHALEFWIRVQECPALLERKDSSANTRVLAVVPASKTVILQKQPGSSDPTDCVIRDDRGAVKTKLKIERTEGNILIARLVEGTMPEPGDVVE
ncbi:MAG: hypothetical protein ACKVS6_07495 [Planctomycetota bacterium]